jgi:predicted enzyme related to lactoylglutathione lyase
MLVNIDVEDLALATRFYTRAFELTLGRRFGTDAVELLGAAAPIYLLAKAAGSAATLDPSESSSMRSYKRHWTPVHLDFVVSELESAVERAREAGAVVEGPILDAAWGRLQLMADPFGNGFCLLEFRGRGYDEIAT